LAESQEDAAASRFNDKQFMCQIFSTFSSLFFNLYRRNIIKIILGGKFDKQYRASTPSNRVSWQLDLIASKLKKAIDRDNKLIAETPNS